MTFFRGLISAAAVLALAACDTCPEPGYEAKATDEAYLALLDVEKNVSVDDGKAALITVAGDGSLATAPLIEWTTGLTASAPRAVLPASRYGWNWKDLIISSAHAHGTPMQGPGHLVRLKVQGLSCPIQHFSSLTSWQVTAAEWQKLADFKGKTLTVETLSAYFVSNRVTEGPFKPSAATTLQLVP